MHSPTGLSLSGFRRLLLTAAAGLALLSGPALAKPAGKADQNKDGWSFTVGALGAYAPDYEGSDDYEFGGAPVIDITYGNFFFGRSGLGFGVPVSEDLTVGLSLVGDGGRDQDDNRALRGLGDIDATAEVKVFAEWDLGAFSLSAKVSQDVLGEGHEGMQVSLGADIPLVRSRELILSLSPSATWASDNYMNAYFGIDARQAVRSGRATYKAEAGFKDVGVSLVGIHPLNDNWAVMGIVSYQRLLGDAADSPIVDRDGTADQGTVAVGLTYQF